MMTLWCIFRSPLMFGGELRDNDEWTLSLLTNPEVLQVLNHSYANKPLLRSGERIVWTAEGEGCKYAAVFNIGEVEDKVELTLSELAIASPCQARDLWSREDIGRIDQSFTLEVPSHGARLLKLS